MIRCPSEEMSVGEVLAAIEELAAQEDPFGSYPIVYISSKSKGSERP